MRCHADMEPRNGEVEGASRKLTHAHTDIERSWKVIFVKLREFRGALDDDVVDDDPSLSSTREGLTWSASLRTSKLQCWRPSPVECMADDEDVGGGQHQNLCNMMQHAKNHRKHINMLGMDVFCSIPTLRTYFPADVWIPRFYSLES